ncbi:hypothetical protein [Sporosarcina sp. Marseille-Q4943]|uniref:hypothetical protein n=1 Tax=Sporosarcina sp. Marseille-Q4943 TaxID=2942204 RepID=UPI00208DBD41|nr:hypothetical protein [Sporosarcina sp. Marseille-Q4943]
MKQGIHIMIEDRSGLSEREKNILHTGILNTIVLAGFVEVVSKGEGEGGTAFNPIEDCFIGLTMIYQKPIPDEMAGSLVESITRRLTNFFAMSEIEMDLKVELAY